MGEVQNYIAQCMWEDYQQILSEYGILQSKEWVSDEEEDEFDDEDEKDEDENEE